MMVRRSMLDDDEFSPRSYGHPGGSEAETRKYPKCGDDSPTVSYTSVAPTVAYESSVDSDSQGTKKSSGTGTKVLFSFLIITAAFLIVKCSGWFGGEDSSGQSAHFIESAAHDISSSFGIHSFVDSLSEGECFALTVDPAWDSDGHIEGMWYTDGHVVDCSSVDAQYRFVGKGTITPDVEWDKEQHKTPHLGRFVWNSSDEEYVYTLLPHNGRFIISEFSSDGSYRYYERYVDSNYSLPSSATQGGVVEVSKDVGDCRDKAGSVRKIDDVDTCWVIVERK